MCILARDENNSGYVSLKIIHRSIEYTLERGHKSKIQHLRSDYVFKLCYLLAENTPKLVTIERLTEGLSYDIQSYDACDVVQSALAAAAYLGLIVEFTELLSIHGIKNTKTHFGTSLRCAIMRDDSVIAALLLENDNSISTSDEFCQAARNGNLKILRMLFANRVEKLSSSIYSDIIASVALGGYLHIFDFMTQKSISDNKLANANDLAFTLGPDGKLRIPDITLYAAIQHGHQELIQTALNNGAETGFIRHRILHFSLEVAARLGNETIIRQLLSGSYSAQKGFRRVAISRA